MDQSSIYRIPAGADVLHRAAREAALPDLLVEPMQALVGAVIRRAGEGPLSIYLCAPDGGSELRDDVLRVLARALAAHVPSTLVVDCDFLNTGLHGLVPQKDALGFLDFLLYGSSIGVITQESEGVRVVGAGSFPVSRRMPFVESAFDEAERRLAAHARCVIFAGPMTVEGGEPHPLTAEVGAVAVVVPGDDARTMEAVDRVAERAHQVWAVQLGAPAPKREPAAAAAPAPSRPAPAEPAARPVLPMGVPPQAARAGEARYSSVLPRIAIVLFGVIVIAFAVWWFTQDHGTDEAGSEGGMPATNTQQTTTAPMVQAPDTMAATVQDTVPATVAGADTTRKTTLPPPVNPADTGGRTGGTQLVNSADIHVMADLDAKWKGWYMIHISSFQESVRAREEVDFLQSREFPVFIVYLDLGPKGKWYRVYCGPFRTREEARDVKKNLDAVPQVRFTRIATIPE